MPESKKKTKIWTIKTICIPQKPETLFVISPGERNLTEIQDRDFKIAILHKSSLCPL